jgi:hypothetical protein
MTDADLSAEARDLIAALETLACVLGRWAAHPPRLGRELMPGEAQQIVLAADRGWQIIADLVARGWLDGQQETAAGACPRS